MVSRVTVYDWANPKIALITAISSKKVFESLKNKQNTNKNYCQRFQENFSLSNIHESQGLVIQGLQMGPWSEQALGLSYHVTSKIFDSIQSN